MPPHVALYLRISLDRAQGTGVENQEDWGREYAAASWPGLSVAVYSDNDRSAAKKDAYLPERERLRADLAAGSVAHIWAVEQSRLQRTELDWFVLADEFEAAGIEELHTRREGVTPVRDIKAGMQAVINADEVRKLRKRVRDSARKAAERGSPPGGPLYGYNRAGDPGRRTLVANEAQAAVIREIADRVLQGEGSTSIARDLNRRDVPTATGKTWQSTGVRSVVTNHIVAGKRYYDPKRTGRGKVYAGTWPAILDEATWTRCCRLLGVQPGGPRRAGTRPTRYKRDSLLSGCIHCEACRNRGDRMVCTERSGQLIYVCTACGRNVLQRTADRYIERELLPRLDALASALGLGDYERRAAILYELERIEARREEFGQQLADEQLDDTTYQAARRRLGEREAVLQEELAGIPAEGEDVSPHAAREGWAGLTIVERRRVVQRYVDAVHVAPGKRGGRPTTSDVEGRLRVVTRVPRPEEAQAALLAGRRRYRETVRSDRPFAATLRFVELWEIDKSPEELAQARGEAAEEAARFNAAEQAELARRGRKSAKRN